MPPKSRKGASAVIKDDKIEKIEKDSDGEEIKDPEIKPSTNDKILSKEDEALREDSATVSEDSSKDRKRDTKKKSYAEASEEEEDAVPKKRASRAVKPKAKLVDESEEEEEEEESEDEYVPPSASPRGKGKTPQRKRKGDDSDDSGSYGKKTKRSRKPVRKPKKKNDSDFSEEDDSDDDWGSKKSGGRSKGASRSRKTPVATPTRRGERNRGKQKVTSYAEDDDDESDGPSAKVKPKSRALEKKEKATRKVEEEVKSEDDEKDESEEELKVSTSKQANGKKSSVKVKAIDTENGLKEEIDEVEEDDDVEESKQPSAKRKAEKIEKAPAKNEVEEDEDVEESKQPSAKRKAEKIDKAPVKKPAEAQDLSSLDFSCDKKTSDGKPWNLKIASWNVAGLRAIVKKNGLDYLTYEKPDIFCLQEVKCPEKKLPPETKVEGYHAYWNLGDKDGYGGTGLYSKEKPLEVKNGMDSPEFDEHGRMITAEYEKFYLVNVYVINSGRGLVNLEKRVEWDKVFREYLKKLDEKKPVILTGDLNVAHEPIDLTNPKTNKKNAGFTQEERDGFTKLMEEGFIDSFRHLYPDKKDSYTFWTNMNNARERNIGWRLDYFVLSKKLIPNLCESTMRSQVYGSDHCPVTLFINV